jgi:carboxymethylenebutenolidase
VGSLSAPSDIGSAPLAARAQPSAYATLAAPVLGIYGTLDRQFPPETVDEFEAQLQAVGVPHEVLKFSGMGHAFVTDLEATRQPGAAADAWAAFLSFLEQNLCPC